MTPRARHLEAVAMLVLATACWSLSFPVMKTMTLAQQDRLPGVSTWFLSALCVLYRFALAAAGMAVLAAPGLRGLTRSEVAQGVGLGLFGSGGLLFQLDGLAYTSASTSAFLTQFYCLLIPLWLAVRHRRWPVPRVWWCSAAVLAGVAVLADFDWRRFRLGRGEIETLIGSVLFTGQILWLQRPRYAGNDVRRFSLVMFAVMALSMVPAAVLTTRSAGDWWTAYSTGPLLVLLGVLVGVCTFGGYLLMNRWQPEVSATQAGLIYCAEPVFVSLLVLFLPEWLAGFAGVVYPNESLTWRLLLGGGLITAANIALTLAPPPPERVAPALVRVAAEAAAGDAARG
jgi:drug/metabolite transporter (DMT)-like permease